MKYNQLGSTGLFVSELALGTMTFGGQGAYAAIGNVQQAGANDLVATAIEAGVNVLDTADQYSEGSSERITGQAIRDLKLNRADIVVATKAYASAGTGPHDSGSSRAHLLASVHGSLDRLQLDYIDLYQVHGFDPATPIEETLRTLDGLVRSGLVRYVGLSNWAAWQITKALGIADRLGLERPASLQAFYSLAARELEREIVPALQSEGVGLLAWSPLAGGLLTGKISRDSERNDSTDRGSNSYLPINQDRAFDIVDQLREIASAHDASIAQTALSWLLHQPQVTSVLIGATKIAQLQDNLRATDLELSADELETLDKVSAITVEYPAWVLDDYLAPRYQQLQDARPRTARRTA